MLPGAWDGGHRFTTWWGSGVVRVHPLGAPWSVWRWLEDSGWTDDFYVNLETPWSSTALGFTTHDHILDVVVRRDPLRISMKDEDELEWATEVGLISPDTADAVRDGARRAVAAAQSDVWPFSADWDRWLPHPEWSETELYLPDGWNDVDR